MTLSAISRTGARRSISSAYGLFQTDTLPFKRMGTAGCGIAPHDDGRIRLQIKDLCAESHAGQPMQRLIKFAHELAAPLIETESYAMRRLNGGALQKAHHFGHEFRRHPVRGEQAHVLEDMEHSTFAAPERPVMMKIGLPAFGFGDSEAESVDFSAACSGRRG